MFLHRQVVSHSAITIQGQNSWCQFYSNWIAAQTPSGKYHDFCTSFFFWVGLVQTWWEKIKREETSCIQQNKRPLPTVEIFVNTWLRSLWEFLHPSNVDKLVKIPNLQDTEIEWIKIKKEFFFEIIFFIEINHLHNFSNELWWFIKVWCFSFGNRNIYLVDWLIFTKFHKILSWWLWGQRNYSF